MAHILLDMPGIPDNPRNYEEYIGSIRWRAQQQCSEMSQCSEEFNATAGPQEITSPRKREAPPTESRVSQRLNSSVLYY